MSTEISSRLSCYGSHRSEDSCLLCSDEHQCIIDSSINTQNITSIIENFQSSVDHCVSKSWYTSMSNDEKVSFALLGLTTEAGEVQDIFKKMCYNGGTLDTEHLKEELGDLLYHVYLVGTQHEISLPDIMIKATEKFNRRSEGVR